MELMLIHQAFVSPSEPGGTRHFELASHLVKHGGSRHGDSQRHQLPDRRLDRVRSAPVSSTTEDVAKVSASAASAPMLGYHQSYVAPSGGVLPDSR